MQQSEGRGRAAILHPSESHERISVGRRAPSDDLAPYVEYLWWVRWHAEPRYQQEVLPAPVVHVSAERHEGEPRLLVVGVQRKKFIRTLRGEGHVVAVAFRPGGFRPLLGDRVSMVTGREVPASELLRSEDRGVAAELLRADIEDDAMVDALSGWLRGLDAQPDPTVDELAALVERVEDDREIIRAEQVAALAGVSLRTLQRRFSDYVGVGPKWVVQRFRLLDVAAAAHSGARVDWAGLAADLGFSDQSHLTRAFTSVVGQPPASYSRTA
ncbi:MAG: AraC family transcriptional regulator [Nocardioidaceae bacterium]